MSKVMRPTLLTAVLSAATLVGYLSYRIIGTFTDPGDAADDAAIPQPALADALPDFSLADLDGESRSIRSWPGKPLIVNFWATWCAPCLREIPLLKQFQSEHPDVQVVGIAMDRREPVTSFAEEMQFNYPVLVGQSEAMNAAAAFGVEVLALPFTVFSSPGGALLGVQTGEIHPEHLANLSETLAALDAGSIDLEAARARIARRR